MLRSNLVTYTFVSEKVNTIIFGNYCSHRSQSCLKHPTTWLMKMSDYQWSRSFFDFGQRSLRFQKLTCFVEAFGRFGTKAHMKSYGRMGMKIYTYELGHMTNMAAMPIMVIT